MANSVQLAIEHGIATLTIDRLERRNALNAGMFAALLEHARTLAKSPPRVVILHGANGNFCSGMDLYPDNPTAARLLPAVVTKDSSALTALIEELNAPFQAIAALPCPVIAAIEGACLGAGFELALTADLRICGTRTKFQMPETQFGMVPDLGGTVRLTRTLGRSRATSLILTGRAMDAEEATKVGLVERTVPDGETLAAAHQLAAQIRESSPAAVREVLRVLRMVDGVNDEMAFAAEMAAGVRTLLTGDVITGLEAFAMKKKPSWT